MLLHSLTMPVSDFEKATGWQIKPEGACKGDVCIPLRGQSGATLQVEQLAKDMNLPLVAEASEQCWALGPDSVGGKT
ncbi:MAG: TlpA family protein disulfide reductase, partial [SAR86 cluster bacterium]|nr:TlpA family protein disulfide reductase [SAR86 cluster bacterium]